MKIFFKWLSVFILALIIFYLTGPEPRKPVFAVPSFTFPDSLSLLEKQISDSEKAIPGIKPDNEARIVWADSLHKGRTAIVFLYLHGFTASQGEGDPVHRDLAHEFHANLFLSRLAGHGIDRGDSTLIDLTADRYEASAEKALAIAEKLGKEVIVIGTSAGGTLALFLASRHPEIKALVLYSPAVQIYDKTAVLLDRHWGLQIARLVEGGRMMQSKPESEAQAQYWQLRYRIEALVALQNLISHTMRPRVFKKIKCPVFLGYYYKNDTLQDKTVSVPAMLKMLRELGTPVSLKQKTAFPDAGGHVIVSRIRSGDWQHVEKETSRFLSVIVKIPVSPE
jgi:pimeloyl-ACP methyl ester carboxylesterase